MTKCVMLKNQSLHRSPSKISKPSRLLWLRHYVVRSVPPKPSPPHPLPTPVITTSQPSLPPGHCQHHPYPHHITTPPHPYSLSLPTITHTKSQAESCASNVNSVIAWTETPFISGCLSCTDDLCR